MDIGEAIKTLRQKQGWTQKELGDRIGMSVNGVSNIELGRSYPPKGTIERICGALGIPTVYLTLAAIDEQDIPEEKRILYRTMLEPLRNELLEKGTIEHTTDEQMEA